eukprot:2692593-Prymnesium_polylepis.1
MVVTAEVPSAEAARAEAKATHTPQAQPLRAYVLPPVRGVSPPSLLRHGTLHTFRSNRKGRWASSCLQWPSARTWSPCLVPAHPPRHPPTPQRAARAAGSSTLVGCAPPHPQ